MNPQASKNSGAVPLSNIMKQLYNAARSDAGQADRDPETKSLPINLMLSARARAIQKSLNRAYRKSVVHTVKPLRRLLRNQGAVNDSLIQAMFDLFDQTQELIEEMTELQRRLNALEAQVKEFREKPGVVDDEARAE